MRLKVALLQLNPRGNDQALNLEVGKEFCRHAREMGADIALFPEMWSIGYSSYDFAQEGARNEWQEQAIDPEGPFIRQFQELARELSLAITITFLEKHNSAPRNSAALIDRNGRVCLTYSKVHTCSFDWECALTPGDEFRVGTLETAQGPVRIGMMICFDREFPESARVLMLRGAEIILVPNACEMEINRMSQLRSRAFENMTGIALANYAGVEQKGRSAAFDGMAFTPEGQSRDMVIAEADEGEQVLIAEFDLGALREYRTREVWGDEFRRPALYGVLVEPEVKGPFVRSDVLKAEEDGR